MLGRKQTELDEAMPLGERLEALEAAIDRRQKTLQRKREALTEAEARVEDVEVQRAVAAEAVVQGEDALRSLEAECAELYKRKAANAAEPQPSSSGAEWRRAVEAVRAAGVDESAVDLLCKKWGHCPSSQTILWRRRWI